MVSYNFVNKINIVENQNSQKDFEDYSNREKGFSSQMFIEKVENYEDLPKFSMEVK